MVGMDLELVLVRAALKLSWLIASRQGEKTVCGFGLSRV